MARYTCITLNRGHSHISQHNTEDPVKSLREHVNLLPFIEGINPIGDELYWLQSISSGKQALSLKEAKKCKNTWIWVDGDNYSPKYSTFIIQTDDNS